MKLLILNGPNLNMLGRRDPDLYGLETLDEIAKKVSIAFPDVDFDWYQSNEEGDLINQIQRAEEKQYTGIIANWGAYTHTSIAIRDALEPVSIPKVEVHLSNIHAREPFREESKTGRVMDGIITGFGSNSYLLGVEAVRLMSKKA
jgi:3-dehydroquinate dehydratase II